MWVHLDVVDLRVARHPSTGRENAGLPLRSVASRMNVGKVNASLLPSSCDQIGTYEAQEIFATSRRAVAEPDRLDRDRELANSLRDLALVRYTLTYRWFAPGTSFCPASSLRDGTAQPERRPAFCLGIK